MTVVSLSTVIKLFGTENRGPKFALALPDRYRLNLKQEK